MARTPYAMGTLLASLPSTSRSLFSAPAVASTSRTRLFSTSPPALVEIKKGSRMARHRQTRSNPFLVQNKRIEQRKRDAAVVPNYILGQIESARTDPTGKREVKAQPYVGSKLQKTLVHPTRIWGAPIPDFAAGETPANYVNGLTEADRDFLFGALPHVTAELQYGDPLSAQRGTDANTDAQKVLDEQTQQTHTLMKILDLRNSSRAEIQRWNKSRVLQVFAGPVKGNPAVTNTGGPRAQAAVLTARIRSLHEHLLVFPKDQQSKRRLRMLIHKRAGLLKYHKRKAHPDEYKATLQDLGLHPDTVEGELTLKGI